MGTGARTVQPERDALPGRSIVRAAVARSAILGLLLTLTATVGAGMASAATAGSTTTSGRSANTSTTIEAKRPAAPTTSTTVPAPATVPLAVTDGQSAATLLANALTLSSVGADPSAVQAAIAATQRRLDADAVDARTAQAAARAADARAAVARQKAAQARVAYQGLESDLKAAVLLLYTSGPRYMGLTVNPAAGASLAFAADYADTTLSPLGLLAQRRVDSQVQQRALTAAKAAQTAAHTAAARATAAVAGEQQLEQTLTTQLAGLAPATARLVEADHALLAAQAGQELVSAASLEFTPKEPIPAPVATTDIALRWLFSELGKPYLWGGTGPASFDCSGLTQYVWAHAGVAIPRVAADQDAWAVPIPLSDLLPGDLVFYGTTDIHHVGMYIGDGLMINAPHTGDVVRVSSIWWSDLAGFGRVHAPGTPVPPHGLPTPAIPATPQVVPTPGAVPSQTKPPPGWNPRPGETTPINLGGPTTTTVPGSTPSTTDCPSSSTTSTSTTSTSSTTSSTSTSSSTSTTSTTTGVCPSTTTTTTSSTTAVPNTTAPPGSTTSPSTSRPLDRRSNTTTGTTPANSADRTTTTS